MRDICEEDRGEIVPVWGRGGEGWVLGRDIYGALRECIVDVRLDVLECLFGDNGTGGCGWIVGVA